MKKILMPLIIFLLFNIGYSQNIFENKKKLVLIHHADSLYSKTKLRAHTFHLYLYNDNDIKPYTYIEIGPFKIKPWKGNTYYSKNYNIIGIQFFYIFGKENNHEKKIRICK